MRALGEDHLRANRRRLQPIHRTPCCWGSPTRAAVLLPAERVNDPTAERGGVGGIYEEQTVAERKQTLQDVESQGLIAGIMENTVFNLVQDIAAGDFDLAETPGAL